MPYTKKQCKLFGSKASRGQDVPQDWKKYCTAEMQKKARKKRVRSKK